MADKRAGQPAQPGFHFVPQVLSQLSGVDWSAPEPSLTGPNPETETQLSYYIETIESASHQLRGVVETLAAEARQMRGALNQLKETLILPDSRERRGKTHSLNMHRLAVLSHLYPALDAPCYELVLASPLPRILMKRRGFS